MDELLLQIRGHIVLGPSNLLRAEAINIANGTISFSWALRSNGSELLGGSISNSAVHVHLRLEFASVNLGASQGGLPEAALSITGWEERLQMSADFERFSAGLISCHTVYAASTPKFMRDIHDASVPARMGNTVVYWASAVIPPGS